MAVSNRQVDYLKELNLEEINKLIEQLNRALIELNKKITNHIAEG
jgi:hypothetical protein